MSATDRATNPNQQIDAIGGESLDPRVQLGMQSRRRLRQIARDVFCANDAARHC